VAKWLIKSEPESFGYDDLVRVKREGGTAYALPGAQLPAGDGQGDEIVFYHSNANPPGVAGIAKVVKTAEPDPTQFDPTSKYYDPGSNPIDPLGLGHRGARPQAKFVSIDELRTLPELVNCRLLAAATGSR
jgi:predicted RNA-binding protein with PUA-like domain